MSPNNQLNQLREQWMRAQDVDQMVTPEELCLNAPAMLAEVQAALPAWHEQNRVVSLVSRWMLAREEGKVASLEELCRDCPELTEAVRQRIERIEALEKQIP